MKVFQKMSFFSLSVLIVSMLFSSCGVNNDNEYKDFEGNAVEVPDTLNKIVSTAPSITEILIGLGLTDKIIAADVNSADTGINKDIATIDMMNMNIEYIVSLSPEVVFVNGMSSVGADDPYNALKDAGITVIFIPVEESIDAIISDISFLSIYTKTNEKGAEMIANIKDMIDKITAVKNEITEKKSVYFEVSEAPYCYSTGKGTYLNEIIELVGGENILSDQEGWLSVTEESIIKANPDIILTNVGYKGYDYNEIMLRPGWNSVNAVTNKSVYQVPSNSTSRASQNIVEGMKAIAKAIYPEEYKNLE